MSAGEAGRLKVAVLNRHFASSAGGAENYSVQIVQAMAARHEIHVFAQSIDHQWPGVHYHRVGLFLRRPRWLNQWLFAWATWRLTRRGFDVVHSHENTWHGDVHTIHVKSVRENLFGHRRGLQRGLAWARILMSPRLLTYIVLEGARFRSQAGRQVVLASEAMRAGIERAYPRDGLDLTVVTPGVTIPLTMPTQAQARQILGLPVDQCLMLLVANDYDRKGLGTALQALARLRPEVHLAVAGRADQQPRFEHQARVLGVRERVHFLGLLENLTHAYAAADLLVHPTREDSFAMVVLEAMAHRLPVVVSAAPWCGLSALLGDEREALLLDRPDDAQGLATAAERILHTPTVAESLREQALALAERHSWLNAASAYEAVFRRSVQARDAVKPPA